MKKQLGKIFLASSVILLAAACNNQTAQETQNPPVASLDMGTQANVVQNNQSTANSVTAAKTPGAINHISFKGEDGKTALDLLKVKYKVDTKHYSFGDFVEGINGVKPDSKHFWEFFVNGKPSNVGAGSYTTKSTDTIEFNLSEIKN